MTPAQQAKMTHLYRDNNGFRTEYYSIGVADNCHFLDSKLDSKSLTGKIT